MVPSHILFLFILMCLSQTLLIQAKNDSEGGLDRQGKRKKKKESDPTKDTELVFALMVHRHGDRTPIPQDLPLLAKLDTEAINALIEPHGYGQLTDVGKRTAYKTGEFIRRRYNSFIGNKFNESEVFIRSTDLSRTKMTVLTAMAAVFRPEEDSWSDEINWVPTPYTTVSDPYDFNRAIANCPKFMVAYITQRNTPFHPRMQPYANLIRKVSDIVGHNIMLFPVKVSQVHGIFSSLISLGYDVGDEIRTLMPEMEQAAGVAWDITSGYEGSMALNAGPLLNEFLVYARKIMEGENTQKMRVYSAHDLNVYSLQAVSNVERQGAPKYASLLSLELRKNVKTGKYYVLPVYLTDPKEGKEKYLEVKDCGTLCDFDTFYNLTSKNAMDENTWREQCSFGPNEWNPLGDL